MRALKGVALGVALSGCFDKVAQPLFALMKAGF